MKKEKNFIKKKIKNFQKYKTTMHGYYLYLAEKKLGLFYGLKFLKFFIDQTGKIKSRLQTGLKRSLQKTVATMSKKNRAEGFIPLSGLMSKTFKIQKKFKAYK